MGRKHKPWQREREPFSDHADGEWTTEAGTRVAVGEHVLAKPQYVSERLPAVVERIYWDPQGLTGGQFDHRGERVGTDDDGNAVFEHPDRYVCVLKVQFRFDVPEGDEYDHMDGKTHRTEAFNLDFVVGADREIRRDRGNCNTEPITG